MCDMVAMPRKLFFKCKGHFVKVRENLAPSKKSHRGVIHQNVKLGSHFTSEQGLEQIYRTFKT